MNEEGGALGNLAAREFGAGFALYAVTDPDGVLADPEVAAAVVAAISAGAGGAGGGLRLLAETDPVRLAAALLAAAPATPDHPLAVVTPARLADLPYSLWQAARPVDLALHRLFGRLDYRTLQRLTAAERRGLAAAYAAHPPPAALGARSTQGYLLTHLFGASPRLPAWLSPADHPDAAAAVRLLHQTPAWALAAAAEDRQAQEAQQAADLLAEIAGLLAPPAGAAPPSPAWGGPSAWGGPPDWGGWQAVARRWAQITARRYAAPGALPAALQAEADALAARLDGAFAEWLRRNYAALAGQRLPDPHHLFHVPAYLHTRRSGHPRIALLVLDGLSLAAWQPVRAAWQARHRGWRLEEQLLLAQVPSVTAISRQALVAGQPPRSFAASLTSNEHEAAQWRAFWRAQGLAERAAAYADLPVTAPRLLPAALDSSYTQLLCLVLPDIDKLVHASQGGLAGLHASLRVWLDAPAGAGSHYVEGLVQTLLDHGYLVVLTSDHGHVEASGMGQPREGVLVESRALRARLYDRGPFAEAVQAQYPDTLLWHDDGLLPGDRFVLMPQGRRAFAPAGALVVSHGGLTVDEMIVPLVTITAERSAR